MADGGGRAARGCGAAHDGKAGMTYILDEVNVRTWTLDNAAQLVAAGYTRLVVMPHSPTGVVGDRRRRR